MGDRSIDREPAARFDREPLPRLDRDPPPRPIMAAPVAREPEPVSEYARRPVQQASAPAQQPVAAPVRPAQPPVHNFVEDDQLDIPAFLRRQVN